MNYRLDSHVKHIYMYLCIFMEKSYLFSLIVILFLMQSTISLNRYKHCPDISEVIQGFRYFH